MIDRWTQGVIPEKPHTVFRDLKSGALLHEECFTRQGFDGPYSILYHRRPPTDEISTEPTERGFRLRPADASDPAALRRRLFDSGQIASGGELIDARTPVLFNPDVVVSVSRPSRSDEAFFVNGDGDDVYFVEAGSGRIESTFGVVPFQKHDYLVVPKGCVHRFLLDGPENRFFGIECRRGFHVPAQFRNDAGQLKMDAAYTHRDFVRPSLAALASAGGAPKQIFGKKNDRWTLRRLAESPLDVVGWDGCVYPVAFPISKFQPKTGLIHLPPTIHITFATGGAVICSFVPRVTDTHPDAIPCPYPHSSVDCDEVIFYVDGNFTSRRGVGPGAISFHPAGVPHGPHPGAYEASIGAKSTGELAVMIDTFLPLRATTEALAVENPDYHESWKIREDRPTTEIT
ncbi:MAG: homogentisate 1,2-dioxygenase [Thermoanaerobaculia bacterium]